MTGFIPWISDLAAKTFAAVLTSFQHNGLPLALAIVTVVLLTVHISTEKIQKRLASKPKISIFASVAFGSFTPLCACGTTAVLLAMLTTTLPWAPVMAFLTSSPLMSPDGFILLAGVIGFPFAVSMLIASLVIGLGSGFITHVIEKRTSFFAGQTRFVKSGTASGCGCAVPPVFMSSCDCAPLKVQPKPNCGCGQPSKEKSKRHSLWAKLKLRESFDVFVKIGLKQILLYFAIFIAVGYLINTLVPQTWILALFSGNNWYSVPLSALIGLPLYITTESSIPVVQSLMHQGASPGAMMAFMITGPATSAWVIAGLTTFMKRKALLLYVAFILGGGILMGYLYDVAARLWF